MHNGVMAFVHFKVPRDLHDFIKQHCEAEGKTISGFFRSAALRELQRFHQRDEGESARWVILEQ